MKFLHVKSADRNISINLDHIVSVEEGSPVQPPNRKSYVETSVIVTTTGRVFVHESHEKILDQIHKAAKGIQ